MSLTINGKRVSHSASGGDFQSPPLIVTAMLSIERKMSVGVLSELASNWQVGSVLGETVILYELAFSDGRLLLRKSCVCGTCFRGAKDDQQKITASESTPTIDRTVIDHMLVVTAPPAHSAIGGFEVWDDDHRVPFVVAGRTETQRNYDHSRRP